MWECGYKLDHWKERTRKHIDDVLYHWITEYHMDGFRFDYTQGIGCDKESQFGSNHYANMLSSDDPTLILVAEEDNALNLMERLRAAGYKAYIRSGENSQGSLTRVFVGPWLDRELVDQYQEELRNEFSLAGDIVRFEIEQL